MCVRTSRGQRLSLNTDPLIDRHIHPRPTALASQFASQRFRHCAHTSRVTIRGDQVDPYVPHLWAVACTEHRTMLSGRRSDAR